MFVLREMCTFIQGIGAGNIGKTSLFTLSLYGIYKGSARYNALLHAAYCMVIKNIDWWLWTLILISTYRRWVCSKGHCPEDVRQSQRAEYFKSLKVKMATVYLNTPSKFQKLNHLTSELGTPSQWSDISRHFKLSRNKENSLEGCKLKRKGISPVKSSRGQLGRWGGWAAARRGWRWAPLLPAGTLFGFHAPWWSSWGLLRSRG